MKTPVSYIEIQYIFHGVKIMTIRIPLGLDNYVLTQENKERQVVWDSESAINGHMLIAGDSGTGKTHRLRRLIEAMLRNGGSQVRFHIFDIHGDITISNESVVKFSETTDYGFNPLAINPDPDFGGVRKQIQRFITGINKTSRKLGPRQEAVLRYLLSDLYKAHKFMEDDPSTWCIRPEDVQAVSMVGKEGRIYLDVAFEEKDLAKSLGCQWDTELKAWWIHQGQHVGQLCQWPEKIWGKYQPTLLDAVRFARRKLEAIFIGANSVAVNYLSDVNSKASAYHRKVAEALRRGHEPEDKDKLLEQLATAQEKAISAYSQYLKSIQNGREMAEVLRYDSVEVLKSVYERLENLRAIGIFRSAVPPFDPNAAVWRYDIKYLAPDERLLFVFFKLEDLFNKAVQRGVVSNDNKIRDVILIDEAHNFFTDDEDNILNRIAKEARKFGIALICASQSPTHFSSDFLTNVALKIMLPLDLTYWEGTARKLNIEKDQLKNLIPRETALVHIKESGRKSSKFRTIKLSQ
ncbi:DUF5710 domain-containing protein [Methylovorus glucosotrophus]|nr:DUF5710 domain-containing protein [Methylovorus glucosotrophus]